MQGAGSEEMCMAPSGENQPPRLRMRRLRALDWFAVQPAARCRWRCGNVVTVNGRRNATLGGWFFSNQEVNVSLGKPSSPLSYGRYSRALVLPKTHCS